MAADELMEMYRTARFDALVALRNADYQTALDLLIQVQAYHLTGVTRMAKDGIELEFGGLDKAIAFVRMQLARASGWGKVRRIPVQHVSPSYGTVPFYDQFC